MTTNGAWVDGVFYDGIDLTAADLNANNNWILAQVAPATLLTNPNTWLAPQTFDGTLITQSTTVAALPASPVDGQRAFVNDAASLTFGSAVTGSGSLHGPVYYDGGAAAWKAG